MSVLHRLKFMGKPFCDAVYSGRKRFEVRYNDRDFQKGDIIFPVPVDGSGELMEHPIIDNIYVVDFVSKDIVGIQPGYCVLSIREIKESDIPKSAKFLACFESERYYTYGTGTVLDKYGRNMRFSDKQLEVIRYGIEAQIDPSTYADPNLSVDEMVRRYSAILKQSNNRGNLTMNKDEVWSKEDVKTLFRNHSLVSIQAAYSPEEIKSMYTALVGEEPSYFMSTSDILDRIVCSV